MEPPAADGGRWHRGVHPGVLDGVSVGVCSCAGRRQNGDCTTAATSDEDAAELLLADGGRGGATRCEAGLAGAPIRGLSRPRSSSGPSRGGPRRSRRGEASMPSIASRYRLPILAHGAQTTTKGSSEFHRILDGTKALMAFSGNLSLALIGLMAPKVSAYFLKPPRVLVKLRSNSYKGTRQLGRPPSQHTVVLSRRIACAARSIDRERGVQRVQCISRWLAGAASKHPPAYPAGQPGTLRRT